MAEFDAMGYGRHASAAGMGVSHGVRSPRPRGEPPALDVRHPGDHEDVDGDMVRPYVVTGGRTQPVDMDLRLDTLVVATMAAMGAPLDFERRRIADLCARPVSVAEISSYLGVPLGVARVLVADMATERLLEIRRQPNEIDIALLERIRDGVQAL